MECAFRRTGRLSLKTRRRCQEEARFGREGTQKGRRLGGNRFSNSASLSEKKNDDVFLLEECGLIVRSYGLGELDRDMSLGKRAGLRQHTSKQVELMLQNDGSRADHRGD